MGERRRPSTRLTAALAGFCVAGGALSACGGGGRASAQVVQVPAEYKSYFSVASKRCPGVLTPQLLAGVAYTESRFQADAESGGRAQGLMQILPEVFKQYGVDANGDGRKDPFTPADSVATGAVVLCVLSKRVAADRGALKGSSQDLLLASYNAGFGNVRKYKGVPPFPETQDYVQQVTLWAGRFAPQFAAASTSAQP